ncbi:MAG: hypothetical protein JO167_14815 [Alphaproteobacteria bacterium]|nr:hypothetical protein [Alphaproteobacteria bacterium]MBV9542532.1 hypothetical protein [Alphaproteobacteria bacterium]MBV9903538.1 hypothetical protein [Alphaproteobacteria bacterium]
MRRIPVIVLAFFALLNIGRGCIHAFAPDGGAHSIAGLDLSTNAQTILSLFAGLGFHQLVTALFQIFVLIWRRDLVVIALALQTAETAAGIANLYFWRTFPVVVPGEMFNTILLAVLALTLFIAWVGNRRAAS